MQIYCWHCFIIKNVLVRAFCWIKIDCNKKQIQEKRIQKDVKYFYRRITMSILWNMLTLCSFLMVRHTHQWKICQKEPSQFLVFSELCANWSLCICEVFMITSELAASHECQIYGQSVKYLNQNCLPELIHLKKTNHILLKCQGLCHVILSVRKKTGCYQKEIC